MTENSDTHDEALGALALLDAYEPDRGRDARVRARCHAVLEKRRHREIARTPPAWRPRLEPAIVGALCAVFLFEVLTRALHLYRF